MRILYVTPLWSGFRDIIIDGKKEATGMPAFIEPLKKLIQLGHQVDFVIGLSDTNFQLKIGANWLCESTFHFVKWKNNGIERIASPFRLYRKVCQILSNERYDFIYCHGSLGAIGNLAAIRYNVPCGMRLYGTFLANEVSNKTVFSIVLKHPLEYLSFVAPKKFLIITNDGTRGDYVYKKLVKKSKYRFYFLLNGVNQTSDDTTSKDKTKRYDNGCFLFFPARIARWKQQHLAVEVLEYLHKIGHKVRLYFAGHIAEPDYWDRIKAIAESKNLDQYIKHLGTLNKGELYWYYRNSLAVLSLYQVSNLSNVVIEALSVGSVVVAFDDGSLDAIIENGVNGILIKTPEDAANSIDKLISNPPKAFAIRECAKARAKETFVSWDERSIQEIDIICNAVKTKGL